MFSQKLPSESEPKRRQRLRSLLVAFFVFLVPFADCPLSPEAQLAGIFDNSGDFDDDFDEIQVNQLAQGVACDRDKSETPLHRQLHFTLVVTGPAPSAWPGLSPDERAPPRV